jgi:isoleucyl-tRNA synthetase
MIVHHPSEEYLADIQSLLPYIESELNVRLVTLTSNDDLVGIKYKANANWPILGRKVGKSMGKVKAALLEVTSDQIKVFMEGKTITVAGFEMKEDDLSAARYVEIAETREVGQPEYETNTNQDVVILLDVLLRPELEAEGRAREVVAKIQQLRKKAGCVATDDIDVYYSFAEGLGAELSKIIVDNEEVFQRVLRRMPMPANERNTETSILLEEEAEVGDDKVVFSLVRA